MGRSVTTGTSRVPVGKLRRHLVRALAAVAVAGTVAPIWAGDAAASDGVVVFPPSTVQSVTITIDRSGGISIADASGGSFGFAFVGPFH